MKEQQTKRALVSARNLDKEFRSGSLRTPVLYGIDIDIHPGEFTLLMGPSGSGKTTLISILAGVLVPTSGVVTLLGENLANKTSSQKAQIRRNGVGFVFQQYNLFKALTAKDNVAEILKLKGLRKKDSLSRAEEILASVGLEERMHHRPHQLSGGQKQRVAIARALAGDPDLIIGDEVTGALDGKTAVRIMKILREYVSLGRGVLVVTHDNRMKQFADRVVTLEDGQIIADQRTGAHENHIGDRHEA